MLKYGVDNFKITLLKTCYSDFQLYNSEIYFIHKFNTTNKNKGYNNSTGGEHSNKGFKHSEETKKRISLIQIGKKPNSGSFKKGHKMIVSKETREKMSNRMKGRNLSEETKRKLSICNTGIKKSPCSEERKRKISEANSGKIRTKEQLERLSKALKGKWGNRKGIVLSDETKMKISISKKGTRASEETRLKMSTSHKKRLEAKC